MRAFFLGSQGYHEVLRLQEAIFKAKIDRQVRRFRGEPGVTLIPDTVLLVEHSSPVYTVGRRDTTEGIPKDCKVEVVKTRRGGGVTFHGPGQITMYPIANIQQLWKKCVSSDKPRSPIEWFSFVLEQAMIDTAKDYNIPTHRRKVGVWSDEWDNMAPRKIGSIGLQLGNWVSMHGAGFNVSNDLSYFNNIIICEMPDASATSLKEELHLRRINVPSPNPRIVSPTLLHHFFTNLRQEENILSTKLLDVSEERDWHRFILNETD
ncbi:putative lipoate protein ligase [Trypanosoma theileri]|uniref:lipoyl(octanoyl) transferase n=1 Tax=Trypanosoma theileri TaxID=67003 RepID=A0A1X0P3T6_9TRYP|nr:putative lipoate protein ligase [Trypanosoma theileri]ORC91498.1 putative lipoate protein ligase [Trypanosoma theileri]